MAGNTAVKRTLSATAILVIAALAACGSPQSPQSDGAAMAQASADPVNPKFKCPPKITVAARAAGAPVDDVIGVRPGMLLDEAKNVIVCAQPAVFFRESQNRVVRDIDVTVRNETLGEMEEPSRPPPTDSNGGMRAIVSDRDPPVLFAGGERYVLAASGAPKAERVFGIWRDVRYETAKRVPVATVKAQLVEKYGPLTDEQDGHLFWVFDKAGQRLDRDAPLVDCANNFSVRTDRGYSIREDCGLVIHAWVLAAEDNPQLAYGTAVAVFDHAAATAITADARAAITKLDADRQAKELNDAAKNGGPQKF
jgi:hypothetical protein